MQMLTNFGDHRSIFCTEQGNALGKFFMRKWVIEI